MQLMVRHNFTPRAREEFSGPRRAGDGEFAIEPKEYLSYGQTACP
jgi:hypothetical protein